MADIRYALWFAEQRSPTPEERRADRITDPKMMSGFWRVHAARTKPDMPVAIWTEPDPEKNPNGVTVFQVGPYVMNTEKHADRWQSFVEKDWLKCTAVLQSPDPKRPALDSWSAAMDEKGPGRWLDGKPAREPTAAERADIIPAAATSEGRGTNTPVDENGEPIDEFWLQIKDGLASCAGQLTTLGKVDSLESANKAAEILERMRALGAQGEAQRKTEKKPWDDGAKLVQAKWVPVLEPASNQIANVLDAITKWKRAEEKRLADKAAEERRAEARKAAEAEQARIADEIAQRKADAEANGEDEPDLPSEADIAARVAEVAAEAEAATPLVDTSVRVGTAHGRAVNKAKIKVGVISDPIAFFAAVKDDLNIKIALQKKADGLARAGHTVPGMEIDEK